MNIQRQTRAGPKRRIGRSLICVVAAAIGTGAVVGSVSTARADAIRLESAHAAASLHDGGVDMVVYYREHPDHFEVVATYMPHVGPYDPHRLRMGLSDGDAVSFGLPGYISTLYRFSRSGNVVAVVATVTDLVTPREEVVGLN